MRLACLALVALVSRATAAGPNVISRVELRDSGAAMVLTIEGSRPPSFTTFASESPARFVVEIAGGELGEVERELAPATGPIAGVRSEQVAGATAGARVAVSFRGEMDGAEVHTRGNALVVTFPKATSTPAALAAAPLPLPLADEATATATATRTATPPPTAARQEIREVGFRQLPEASRVYIRTAAAPRFALEERSDALLVLRLDGARLVRANDARPLDTTFFPSAVSRVTPRRENGGYVVEIALRHKVAYQQRVEGDLLAIDFELPGATASAAP